MHRHIYISYSFSQHAYFVEKKDNPNISEVHSNAVCRRHTFLIVQYLSSAPFPCPETSSFSVVLQPPTTCLDLKVTVPLCSRSCVPKISCPLATVASVRPGFSGRRSPALELWPASWPFAKISRGRAVPKGDSWFPHCEWLIVLLPRIQTSLSNFLVSDFLKEDGPLYVCVCVHMMSLETFKWNLSRTQASFAKAPKRKASLPSMLRSQERLLQCK